MCTQIGPCWICWLPERKIYNIKDELISQYICSIPSLHNVTGVLRMFKEGIPRKRGLTFRSFTHFFSTIIFVNQFTFSISQQSYFDKTCYFWHPQTFCQHQWVCISRNHNQVFKKEQKRSQRTFLVIPRQQCVKNMLFCFLFYTFEVVRN